MYTKLSKTSENLVAIADCTQITESATASFKELETLHRRYYSRYFERGSSMAYIEHG